MAIIPQKTLFDWTQVEKLGHLARLQVVLGTLPDEELMRDLECERGKGRDDYPVRAVWNSILAGGGVSTPVCLPVGRQAVRV